MLLALTFLAAGFLLLVKGADWLVEGASSLAKRLGMSDLFIGLTIVAFGTSMPELIVNIFASLNGNTDIAIGNIVGSNIANTLLILGATALFASLRVQSSTVRKEIPFSLLAVVVLTVLANDGMIDGYAASELGRGDGLTLIAFFVIFLYYTVGIAKNTDEATDDDKEKGSSTFLSGGLILLGAAMLAWGGNLAVSGASTLAQLLGISDTLIGLTVVAVGTSFPELASSVVAAYKGKADIAVGNVVGSNIFNIFWILGVSAIIKPLPFGPAMNTDLLVVIGSTLLLFLLVHNGGLHRRVFLWWRQRDSYGIRISEGVALLGAYVVYIAFVVWRG